MSKTEVRTNRGLLLNVSHEQKSEQIMTTIGYARVSTDGQSLQSQTEALHTAGCGRVYSEKQSGAYADRPQLAKAIAALAAGDCLAVCKLDRLARSTRDLLNTLDAIGKAGATFRSLADQWADTTTPHGRLMLTVLGGLAEFERHLILSRTAEGRTRAQANGVRFGRKPSLTPYQRAEALRRRAAGETLTEIAQSFNVSETMIVCHGLSDNSAVKSSTRFVRHLLSLLSAHWALLLKLD
jgi:DNA invertase Pin-like site-specific DNA recombinase